MADWGLKMAEVKFDKGFAPALDSIDVCGASGMAATGSIKQKLAWAPPWIAFAILFGIVPFLLLHFALAKRATIVTPASEEFLRRFRLGRRIAWGGVIAAIALVVYALSEASPVAGWSALLVALFVPAIGGIVMKRGWIRPQLLDGDVIRITKLHPEFARRLSERIPLTLDGEWSYPPPPAAPPTGAYAPPPATPG